MAPVTAALLLACIPAVAGLALIITVIMCIHREESGLTLSSAPRTAPRKLARRIAGLYVDEAYAARVFSARHAASQPAASTSSSASSTPRTHLQEREHQAAA
jgi:hypothetical protein